MEKKNEITIGRRFLIRRFSLIYRFFHPSLPRLLTEYASMHH